MAKEGKRGIGRTVLIVLVALVVIGGVGSMMGGGSGTGTTGTGDSADAAAGTDQAAPEEQPAEEQEPYTVTDEQLDPSNPYGVFINGTLTNNTDNEVSYIQVEYNLYDADGAQIGTSLANTNNLQPGGTWKFEAVGTASPDEVATFELIDVTGF